MKTKFRLLLVAAILVGTSFVSTTAGAWCPRYCWHVDTETSCCQTFSCEIVC
ncbi:MAG TPA: hypothetical protein VMW27_18440 [Thermoanaerobaculia bacterium]|nr:hypothetical protein [Thermoanaerobaculia bacterium]